MKLCTLEVHTGVRFVVAPFNNNSYFEMTYIRELLIRYTWAYMSWAWAHYGVYRVLSPGENIQRFLEMRTNVMRQAKMISTQ